MKESLIPFAQRRSCNKAEILPSKWWEWEIPASALGLNCTKYSFGMNPAHFLKKIVNSRRALQSCCLLGTNICHAKYITRGAERYKYSMRHYPIIALAFWISLNCEVLSISFRGQNIPAVNRRTDGSPTTEQFFCISPLLKYIPNQNWGLFLGGRASPQYYSCII